MRDSDVRHTVLEMLSEKHAHDSNTRIVEEMGIWNGSVRIDIAVINGEMHGFELKSERDTLARLDDQAALYNEVFDRVTLVAALSHIEKAIERIPVWWSVSAIVADKSGNLRLKSFRKGKRNPAVDPIQLARLLWNSERISLLDRYGLLRGFKSKSSDILSRRLVENLPVQLLTREVREALKARTNWLWQPTAHQGHMAADSD